MAEASPSPTLSPTMSAPSCHDQSQEPTMDFNVMVIVAAMLCAFVCALGLNSMLQCVFQCTQRTVTETAGWISSSRQNSGLRKREMVGLPTSTYARQGSPSSTSGCAICLADFTDGDKIRVLPKCNHEFHVDCIDKWLLSHSSCPTCRQRLKSIDEPVPSLEQIVTPPCMCEGLAIARIFDMMIRKRVLAVPSCCWYHLSWLQLTNSAIHVDVLNS